jgi:magnesium transporter
VPVGDTGAVARTRGWRKGILEAENFPLEQVSDYLERDDCVVWADLTSPDLADLKLVADELGLSSLAVEDAMTEHERPKVDHYPSHLFVTFSAVLIDSDGGRPRLARVSAFVLPRALVTVRPPDLDMEVVVRAWDEASDLAEHGVRGLLYGLLDVVVDGHLEAIAVLDDRIEDVEDMLFVDGPASTDLQRYTFELRRSLAVLRKAVMPMRDVVSTLVRRDAPSEDPLGERYRDLEDHVLRAVDATDHMRDLITTIFETGISLGDAELNQVVRRLSAWAAIIAVPTAVTGFYGQNVPYPGYGQWWGFLLSTIVTLLLAGGFYWSFKRRGWL